MFRALPLKRINHSLSLDWDLNEEAVKSRRSAYGTNDLIEKHENRLIALMKETLLDPMIWFLILASILFFALKEYTEAIILLFAIIPIGGMDAFLHWRTQVSTSALSSRLITFTHVKRDHVLKIIPTREIVPGDLVLVKASNYFPADGIIIHASHAQVDESSLTGEAFPVVKQSLTTLPNHDSEPLIGYEHWGFVGTRLLTGEVWLRVVYTGKQTIYGEIINTVLQTTQEKTPLQKALNKLVTLLIIVASAFCVLLAFVRYYQGFGLIDALLSAATLAVVALPEEFPMVFTFFLGVGVYRLAKNHALVRRAVTVENIGRVTTICSDKTGTITEGRFAIAAYAPANGISNEALLTYAALAARKESGDLLDMAILNAASKQGMSLQSPLHVLPFTEERMRETSFYDDKNAWLVVTKGAPETILQLTQLDASARKCWRDQMHILAGQAYKVIACAKQSIPKNNAYHEPESGYQWLGLLAFYDPPREAVYAAIKTCEKDQIKVLMITGDHPETAKKIAMDIGLGRGEPVVILASEAEQLLEAEGGAFLSRIDVIARAIPSQKLSFVTALQKQDDIVAVTGDGVNDVPALRAADIGIAMGERGTQSAREAASIILLDDNFGSIVKAISEGRALFSNMRLSFKYLLLIHIPYILSATIIPLLGFPLLYYPIHVVGIELLIHPTCILVFQNLPGRNDRPTSKKSNKDITFFSRFDWMVMSVIGFYTSCLVVMTYLISLSLSMHADVARANAFTAVVLTHMAITIGLSQLKTWTARIIVMVSLIMLLVLVQIPFIAQYFLMQPPPLSVWGVLVILSSITAYVTFRWR